MPGATSLGDDRGSTEPGAVACAGVLQQEVPMRAMVYRGPYRVRVEEKDRPVIDETRSDTPRAR